jgi:patatin-like phospholipase/acyl hydrolase
MAYKILSLDGGGSRNILQALTLGDIYGLDTAGKDVLGAFDLAVANSGGAIVLAGLLLNRTPRQMVDLVLQNTQNIFQPAGFDPVRAALSLFKVPTPKFSTEKKRVGLLAALPDSAVGMKTWQTANNPCGAPVKALISAISQA